MVISPTDHNARHSQAMGKVPLWEWALAAIGAVMLIGISGYITFHGLYYPEAPPQVIVENLGSSPSGTGYLVRIRVQNLGNSTASSLRVSGQLVHDAVIIETSEVYIDHLPQHSQRAGGLFFTQNPARGQLLLRAEGYVEP